MNSKPYMLRCTPRDVRLEEHVSIRLRDEAEHGDERPRQHSRLPAWKSADGVDPPLEPGLRRFRGHAENRRDLRENVRAPSGSRTASRRAIFSKENSRFVRDSIVTAFAASADVVSRF